MERQQFREAADRLTEGERRTGRAADGVRWGYTCPEVSRRPRARGSPEGRPGRAIGPVPRPRAGL